MFAVMSTAQIATALRALMVTNTLAAYIVPPGDAHHTEFIAACHQRRAFISGFTGSAGTAIVTATDALLWTDGRYYLQAEQQLESPLWTLMKDGLLGTPKQSEWLISNLKSGDRVGVDPTLYSKSEWDSLEKELKAANIVLVAIQENLVDHVWGVDGNKPNCSSNPLVQLGMEFSGRDVRDKLADVRAAMVDNSAEILVVTELDEVAWLLNLRGDKDIPHSSIFFSYVIVTASRVDIYMNLVQATDAIQDALRTQISNIDFHEYETVYAQLEALKNGTQGKVWLSRNANYALVSVVPEERQIIKLTPISLLKAVKNEVEVAGFRNALLRDAAAISVFLTWLEDAMSKGENITEISAANHLLSIRQQRDYFMDLSFPTISATGPNGAVIHYMPTETTNRKLEINDMYLLDSGGLYKDGTTDITRTVHFGTPTDFQRECYTRVLKGQIALARAIFPNQLVGHRLDSFAREALWAAGLDYAHGTGHGIGSYLNVHEGPSSVSFRFSETDPGLRVNMFTSNEPGYYDEKEGFGIRLENIIRVTNVTLSNNFQSLGFLGFEDMTLLPYQHKLIDTKLLTDVEISYLIDYQEKCRNILGKYIQDEGLGSDVLAWLEKETIPIVRDDESGGSTTTEGTTTGGSTTTEGTTTGGSTTAEGSTTTIRTTTAGSNGIFGEMQHLFISVIIFTSVLAIY